MRTTSASPDNGLAADAVAPAPTPLRKVLVWDAPVRVFHWLMVFSFAGAYLTAESERWRLEHVTLGYTMAGLVAFRLIWGIVGSRHARFANFLKGPGAVLAYLREVIRGRPAHTAGHNPAGALAIVALLGMTAAVAASGWAVYNEIGGSWLEEVHEVAANLMLAVIAVHLAGVLLSSWLHHDNLIGAMLSGRKRALPQDAVPSAWRSVAALMLVIVLGYWWSQWNNGAATGAVVDTAASARHHDRDD